MKFTPFEIELLRDFLAQQKKYEALVHTYTRDFPVIPNLNTPQLWDALNCNPQETKNPMAQNRVVYVAKQLTGRSLRLLDVGFGSGVLERYLLGCDRRVTMHGIDISPRSITRMRRIVPEGVFEVGSILRIPKQFSGYNYVVALEVLEHIQPHDTFRALRELYRVINDQGILIVSVPLHEGLKEMVEQGKNPNAHVRVYTPAILRAELQIVGFEILNEHFLYAFNSFYTIKTWIVRYLLKNARQPNNLILVARKIKQKK